MGITDFAAEPVERGAGDQAERRIPVIEETRSREATPAASRPKASDSCGIITPGAERMKY